MKEEQKKTPFIYRMMMAIMKLFSFIIDLSCESFIKRASQKYDHPLNRGEQMKHNIHRAICKICRNQERHMDQLRLLTKELGETLNEEIKLSDRARNTIKEQISELVAHKTEKSKR